MNTNSSCPCCSRSMLHHLSSCRSYWFCSHCRLEMPNLQEKKHNPQATVQFGSASIKAAIRPNKPLGVATAF